MPREKLTTHALRTDGRLEHGAVPLDPWRATHTSGVPAWHNLYVSGSATRIERRLTRNMVEGEWFKRVPQAHQLFEMMRESLIDSQNRRIDMNSRAQMKDISSSDERVVRALEGTASPEELFTLLVDMPEIGSLELAKLSHPFDFEATDVMDRQMDELMLASEGELLDGDPRYKLKRVNEDIPAGILLRKQDLMDFPTADGVVRIVQRRGFLVFQGEGKEDELHFDRLLKNPKNHRALFAMTESTITDSPGIRPFGWVQPQATSYYAKFIANSPIQLM